MPAFHAAAGISMVVNTGSGPWRGKTPPRTNLARSSLIRKIGSALAGPVRRKYLTDYGKQETETRDRSGPEAGCQDPADDPGHEP
jgi:hypothetical protein